MRARRLISFVRTHGGFTLLEICLAVFIALLLVTLAVPSLSGLLAGQEAKRSFDNFDALAREAQSRSVTERRPYLLAWDKTGIDLRPAPGETMTPGRETPIEEGAKPSRIDFAEKETYDLELPAALVKKPALEWIFWPSGTCEPATVTRHSAGGGWSAVYDGLTVRAVFSTL